MQKIKPIDLTFSGVFVCLMAIGANITILFPILAIPIGGMSVPLSLQTFFAILAGFMLGRKVGSLAMIVYILVGTTGVPIFAGMTGGPMVFISPTGGFIISFIFTAYTTGLFAHLKTHRRRFNYTMAAFIGLLMNYSIGVSYMYVAINTWLGLRISYKTAWLSMLPFLIKDAFLSCLAVFFMIQMTKRLPKYQFVNFSTYFKT